MSVSQTAGVSLNPLYPCPPLELQSQYPMAILTSWNQIVGDGSGGGINSQHYPNHYGHLVITEVYFLTDDTAAAGDVLMLRAQASDFISLVHFSNLAWFGIWQGISSPADMASRSIIDGRYPFNKPVYLGKLIEGHTGLINYTFQTNTNTKNYNFYLKGLVYGDYPRVIDHLKT